MYAEALAALEASSLGQAARGLTWLYPLANLIHVLGSALLVGAIAVFDIAVLRGRTGEASVARIAIAVAAFGLALQIPSGVVLLSAEATAAGVNPAFLLKMALVAIGLVNVAYVHARFGRMLAANELPVAATIPAVVSLVAWVVALLAGRAIAYL
ncbi:MAG: DUF6644 family protein [Alsobacter sp.]